MIFSKSLLNLSTCSLAEPLIKASAHPSLEASDTNVLPANELATVEKGTSKLIVVLDAFSSIDLRVQTLELANRCLGDRLLGIIANFRIDELHPFWAEVILNTSGEAFHCLDIEISSPTPTNKGNYALRIDDADSNQTENNLASQMVKEYWGIESEFGYIHNASELELLLEKHPVPELYICSSRNPSLVSAVYNIASKCERPAYTNFSNCLSPLRPNAELAKKPINEASGNLRNLFTKLKATKKIREQEIPKKRAIEQGASVVTWMRSLQPKPANDNPTKRVEFKAKPPCFRSFKNRADWVSNWMDHPVWRSSRIPNFVWQDSLFKSPEPSLQKNENPILVQFAYFLESPLPLASWNQILIKTFAKSEVTWQYWLRHVSRRIKGNPSDSAAALIRNCLNFRHSFTSGPIETFWIAKDRENAARELSLSADLCFAVCDDPRSQRRSHADLAKYIACTKGAKDCLSFLREKTPDDYPEMFKRGAPFLLDVYFSNGEKDASKQLENCIDIIDGCETFYLISLTLTSLRLGKTQITSRITTELTKRPWKGEWIQASPIHRTIFTFLLGIEDSIPNQIPEELNSFIEEEFQHLKPLEPKLSSYLKKMVCDAHA